jgi:hypothetical protein
MAASGLGLGCRNLVFLHQTWMSGWPGCGRSFVALLESYVDLLKAKRERNNQELLGAPSTD